ncbi:hypothetical protein [Bacillus sp. SM2101]|uniref:hypothetical protein n=1 Tax=Bacillus sp. SM2101 TaxID=2805366 RepID=UPI001BDECA90|nr:hypothetical protein [Bacillus sp. SM2101]
MTIEQYIKHRRNGKEIEEIKEENLLSEETTLTFELGYQCYLKKLPLDRAISFIQKIQIISPSDIENPNPYENQIKH